MQQVPEVRVLSAGPQRKEPPRRRHLARARMMRLSPHDKPLSAKTAVRCLAQETGDRPVPHGARDTWRRPEAPVWHHGELGGGHMERKARLDKKKRHVDGGFLCHPTCVASARCKTTTERCGRGLEVERSRLQEDRRERGESWWGGARQLSMPCLHFAFPSVQAPSLATWSSGPTAADRCGARSGLLDPSREGGEGGRREMPGTHGRGKT